MEIVKKTGKLLLAALAVYLLMHYLVPLFLPFLAALLLAAGLYQIASRIEQKTGWKKNMVRAAVYLLFLLAVAAVLAGICYLCCQTGSYCMAHVSKWIEDIRGILRECCRNMKQLTGSFGSKLVPDADKTIHQVTVRAASFSREAGTVVLHLSARIFVTFVAAYLILNDYERIREKLRTWVHKTGTQNMGGELGSAAGAYLLAQLKIMGIITALCIAGLYIAGISSPWLFGFLIGFCDALPFLGTGTILIPWAVILFFLKKTKQAVLLLILYLVCTFTRQMTEPKLVGKKLGIPPVAVLLSLYIGIQIYGGAGIIYGPVSALLLWKIYNFRGSETEEKPG